MGVIENRIDITELERSGGGGGGGTAASVSYDNTTSHMTATNVQAALDELNLNIAEGLALVNTSVAANREAILGKAGKDQISNRNLLDNGWFTVNQRGQNSYSGSGYTIDRWLMASSGTTPASSQTINADGSITTTSPKIYQYFDIGYENLAGKNVTASVMDENGNIYSVSGTVPSTKPTEGTASIISNLIANDYKFNLVYTVSTGYFEFNIRSATSASTEFTIKAIKLEIGTVSTLAMDTAPNYAEELLKCQRYFQRIGGTNSAFATGWFTTTSLAYLFTKLSTPMRTAPTVTMNGTVYVWSPSKQAGSSYAVTTINTSSYENNGIAILLFSIDGSETVGVNSLGQFRDTTSYIDLSADL